MTDRKTLGRWAAIICVALLAIAYAQKAPSPEWCDGMKAKDKGAWTTSEATTFAKNCAL